MILVRKDKVRVMVRLRVMDPAQSLVPRKLGEIVSQLIVYKMTASFRAKRNRWLEVPTRLAYLACDRRHKTDMYFKI